MKDNPGGRSVRWPLYVLVSISGAAVLTVEILGTRIIGPYYGVSIFLWSALISVTLLALSLGYAAGGRLADRKASVSSLGVMLALAGLWLALVPLIRRPVIGLMGPLDLRPGVLAAAAVLFFPPLFLLGMVTPMAVKLRAGSLGEVGRSAGDLYAVSTVASVAAALLTGFILIPRMGISLLTVVTGAVLIVSGAVCVIAGKARTAVKVSAGALFILAAAASLASVAGGGGDGSVEGLVALKESPYAEIRVVDYRNARFLLIDGAIHTFVDSRSGENLFPYVHVLEITKSMFDAPGDMLLVGLGGGTLARRYANDGWNVDAVEIDPVITELAGEYFRLEPGDAEIHVMDGRRFLASTDKEYDLVILDAFGSGSVPFHLVTEESFRLVSSRLKPGGMLAMNIQSVGWRSRLVRSVGATLGEVFEHHRALPIAEPPSILGNLIMLASDREIELPAGLPDPDSRYDAEYDRMHAWTNSFVPDTEGAVILTDDHNPVALWSEQVNLEERKGLKEYFADLGPAYW